MTDNQIKNEIQEKGLTAPRVTPQRIEDVIAEALYAAGYRKVKQ